MRLHTFRLAPGQELRSTVEDFCRDKNIQSAVIVTCVASIVDPKLRMAGAEPDNQDIRDFNGDFEVVSLVGTIVGGDAHLHISCSDKQGKVIGGHLKSAKVRFTAEVSIGEDEHATYTRQLDNETGFEELVVTAR